MVPLMERQCGALMLSKRVVGDLAVDRAVAGTVDGRPLT